MSYNSNLDNSHDVDTDSEDDSFEHEHNDNYPYDDFIENPLGQGARR